MVGGKMPGTCAGSGSRCAISSGPWSSLASTLACSQSQEAQGTVQAATQGSPIEDIAQRYRDTAEKFRNGQRGR
jgi:hypothetical protein